MTNGCASAGLHYNPHNTTHAGPADEVRHVGDLGNVEAGADGTATLNLSDRLINIYGEFSVVGRAMICHEKTDDLGRGGDDESKKTGNAGKRLSCGLIGISGPF